MQRNIAKNNKKKKISHNLKSYNMIFFLILYKKRVVGCLICTLMLGFSAQKNTAAKESTLPPECR